MNVPSWSIMLRYGHRRVCPSVYSLHCLSPSNTNTTLSPPLPPPLEVFSSPIVLFIFILLLLHYFFRLLFVILFLFLHFFLACDSLSRCYVKCNTRICLFILKAIMSEWISFCMYWWGDICFPADPSQDMLGYTKPGKEGKAWSVLIWREARTQS